MLTMFFGCCGTRFAQTSSHLIQKTSTILLIFLWRTNEQPYDFMKKWAYFGVNYCCLVVKMNRIC